MSSVWPEASLARAQGCSFIGALLVTELSPRKIMLRWRPTFISQSPDIHQLGCSSEPSFGVSNWADIWTPITELQIHGDLISDDCGVVWSLAHARGSSVDQCQWKGLSYHGIFNKDTSNQSDMFGRQWLLFFILVELTGFSTAFWGDLYGTQWLSSDGLACTPLSDTPMQSKFWPWKEPLNRLFVVLHLHPSMSARDAKGALITISPVNFFCPSSGFCRSMPVSKEKLVGKCSAVCTVDAAHAVLFLYVVQKEPHSTGHVHKSHTGWFAS